MTTIEEGNKLIADFMGVKIGEDKYFWRPGCYGPLKLEHLGYDKYWGWLMPVVEKIEEGNYGVKLCRKRAEIYYDDTKEVILSRKEKSRIESTWSAVVDFIVWHNYNHHEKTP